MVHVLRQVLSVAAAALPLLLPPCWAQDSLGVRTVARWELWHEANEFAIHGNRLYVASGCTGLKIVDVTDPTQPRILGSYLETEFYSLEDVAVDDQYVYLPYTQLGFQVVDARDPEHVVLVGSHEGPWSDPCTIEIYDHYAYVGAGDGLGAIYDVSDPTNIQEVGPLPVYWHDCAIVDSYLYVPRYDSVMIFHLADPAHPSLVGAYIPPCSPFDVAVSETLLFVGCYNGGLRVVDISDPGQPEEIANVDTGMSVGSVAVSGHYCYMATMEEGLRIVDFADPYHPLVVGVVHDGPSEQGLLVDGNYAYTASGRGEGFCVIDVSDPTTPFVAASCGVADLVWNVAISDEYAFAVDRRGLRTVRLESAESPFVAELMLDVGNPAVIAVSGNQAYVARAYMSFWVTGISDPLNPTIDGWWTRLGDVHDLAAMGDHAFVIEQENGFPVRLRSIDVSAPDHPVEVFSAYMSIPASHGGRTTVRGNYLWIPEGALASVNIIDPGQPVRGGYCWVNGTARDVAFVGEKAYVPTYDSCLHVVDISNPEEPCVVAAWSDFPPIDYVAADQGRIVALTREGELMVLDVTDYTQPRIAGYYRAVGLHGKLAAQGGKAVLWDYFHIDVYDYSEALATEPFVSNGSINRFELGPCYPNPFNPVTVVPFSLPQPGPVTLSVFDITGRRVATPVNGILDAGTHRVRFDGTPLTSGLYFCRLDGSGQTQAIKLVLTK